MKVLIAEDDPVSRRLLEVSLTNWGYQVTMAIDGAETLRKMDEPNSPRLMILDWMMPRMDGVEVCRAIRQLGSDPYVYIIFLTARGRQEEIVEGLDAGADDYITKPFDLHELRARLRSGKRILELQEQIVSAREQLRAQATHDSLTEVWNRSSILETLNREVIRAAREKTLVGAILVDIDHFKQVNDTYGHLAGDEVLRETTRRMLAAIRSYDSIGRYGGEEFLIIAPGCTHADVTTQAERLRASVSMEPVYVLGHAISVTVSVGVATKCDSSEGNDLLRAADEALYEAKNAGRDRVEANFD